MRIFERSKAQWPERGCYRSSTIGGERSATITCPNCGLVGSLAGNHEVGPDGTVTPSVVCVGDGCEFHKFIQLEGWNNE